MKKTFAKVWLLTVMWLTIEAICLLGYLYPIIWAFVLVFVVVWITVWAATEVL